MKDKLTSASQKVATHVVAHRGLYGAAAGAITTAVAHHKFDSARVAQWNAFLEEKGLTDEFYGTE